MGYFKNFIVFVFIALVLFFSGILNRETVKLISEVTELRSDIDNIVEVAIDDRDYIIKNQYVILATMDSYGMIADDNKAVLAQMKAYINGDRIKLNKTNEN